MMKLLVLLAVLAIAYLVWRASRVEKKAAPPPQQRPALPQEMVQCARCTVHLPRGEALAGRDGRLYCSTEHRLLGDGS
jgi:uncharacterized protein